MENVETSTPEANSSKSSSLHEIAEKNFSNTYFPDDKVKKSNDEVALEKIKKARPEAAADTKPAADENEPQEEVKAEEVSAPDTADANEKEVNAEAKEANAEANEEASEDSSDSQEDKFNTLDELLEAGGADAKDVKVSVKIDGKQKDITLSELVAEYQIDGAASNRLELAKETAKKQQEENSAIRKSLDEAATLAAATLARHKKATEEHYNSSIDWERLYREDRPEFSRKMAERDQILASYDQDYERLATAYNRGKEQEKELKARQNLQASVQRLKRESAMLLEKEPKFADEKWAQDERNKIAEYLFKNGFSQEDVEATSDHRMVLLAQKAMRYEGVKAGEDLSEKKTKKIPKTLTPGKKTVSMDEAREKKARAVIRDNPNSRHAEDAALEILRSKRK